MKTSAANISHITIEQVFLWLSNCCQKHPQQDISLLIVTHVKDPETKTHLLQAIKTIPCIQRKAQWALRWCNLTAASFTELMIAGSFSAIFWLKKRGLMPGLCFSNELNSHNKELHCDVVCLL
jgi:ribonucleoside-diphosphate reductase subunit M2